MFNELDRLSNQFFKDSEDFINKMKKRIVSYVKAKGGLKLMVG